jgi:hypothetical protein
LSISRFSLMWEFRQENVEPIIRLTEKMSDFPEEIEM